MIHLSVVSPKGGVGKTLLSLQLAASFAQSGLRVNLIDHDPQGSALVFGKLAQRAGRELPFAITPVQASRFEVYIHDHAPGVLEHYPSKVLIMPVVLDAPSGTIHRRGRELLEQRGYSTLEVVNRFRADRAGPRRALVDHYMGSAVIAERTLYSNLYGRGQTVFDDVGVAYVDRARSEIMQVRHALDQLMAQVAV